MYSGIDSKGQHLHSYAWASYARKKNQMNSIPGYGNPDLRLSGSFYERMTASASKEGITVYSTDEKAASLEGKYGKQIWTLYTEWLQSYIEKLRPAFTDNVAASLSESPF